MGMYYCDECQEFRDDDYSPCIEWNEGQLLCAECQPEHICEWCGEVDEEVKDGWHIGCKEEFLAEIRLDAEIEREAEQ